MKVTAKLLFCVLLFCFAIPAAAQQNKTPKPTPTPIPSPANDYNPQRWKDFSSTAGRFKIRFPDTPQQSTTEREAGSGKLIIHNVEYQSFIYYSVVYIDYPQNIDDPATAKRVFDVGRDGGLAGIAETKPKLIKEADTLFNGHPQRFIQIDIGGTKVLRVKYVAVKNRFYTVTVITPKGQPNTLGAENDYEKLAMSFLNGFQLVE